MRNLSTALMQACQSIAQASVVRGRVCVWLLCFVVSWVALGGVVIPSRVGGQQPGTFPPAELIRPSATPAESGKLPIQGMFLLDEADVRVYLPPMSYEAYLELERGAKNRTRRYIFERVKIDGRVEGNRAELTVEVRVAVDATGDETVEIPLAMENFHLLGAAEFFSGAENGNKLAISVDEDSGSCELIASVAEDTVVGFRMQMSSRVETQSIHALDFRLPPAPILINLTSDSRDVVGQIPNRDDEVIETTADASGRSKFKVESSGGRFTLQWGKLDRPVSMPLLESTSVIAMQWNSPQDQLIQSVKMTVRDSRGPISGFRLRLPKDASLRDDPKLITSGQFGQLVELSKPDSADKELFQITIPVEEREKTIALEFRLEIPSDSPTAANALQFQVPVIENALRNEGTINITTGADYRLRWRQRSYVKNTTSAGAEDSTVDQRSYSFQFIRGAFVLPLWLDATKSELRVSSECDIELRETYANLAMEIRSVGNGNRAQLLSVDLADWQTPLIENARTGAPLPWYESDDVIEIEVSYTGMEESIPVLIKARRPIESGTLNDVSGGDGRHVDLPVPRVVGSGDRLSPVTIQEAFVRLSGKGRRSLVVDLERSTNLERATGLELSGGLERGTNSERSAVANSQLDDSIRIFAVMPPESSARIVGEMVLQSPRISLENTSTVKLIGNQLVTTVDWKLETPVDLEGRLRIAVPQQIGILGQTETADAGPIWSVNVNEGAAQLQPVSADPDAGLSPAESGLDEAAAIAEDNAGGKGDSESDSHNQVVFYDLISDALADGTMNVHFVRSEPVVFDDETSEALAEIGLPYPTVQDVTLKGNVEVELLGGELYDITPSEKSLTDKLVFRTLPMHTIPLRISPRTPAQSELLTGKIYVRSAISEISQHDQLLASVTGTGEFELWLQYPNQTDIQVTLNGVSAAYKTIDDRLVIRIPSDAKEHLVDVRLWVDLNSRGVFQAVEPLVHLGPGSGQLYWQLTMPADCHLVWAVPSVAREMQWTFDRWRLIRQPLLSETTLVNRIASSEPDSIDLSPMPNGNHYLFSSMDDRSFRAMAGTRTMLWMIVAGAMVFVTAILTYIPVTRNPFSLAIAIACFTGLLAVAPDAAVLVGQVSMLALVLVVVMLAIRSLVLPKPSRVLSSTRDGRFGSSIQSRRSPAEYRPPSSIAVTHSIGPEDISSTPDEVAS